MFHPARMAHEYECAGFPALAVGVVGAEPTRYLETLYGPVYGADTDAGYQGDRSIIHAYPNAGGDHLPVLAGELE